MRHSGRVKLRNVLFPIWFLYLYPPLWLYVIPANFLIDSAGFCSLLRTGCACRRRKRCGNAAS